MLFGKNLFYLSKCNVFLAWIKEGIYNSRNLYSGGEKPVQYKLYHPSLPPPPLKKLKLWGTRV